VRFQKLKAGECHFATEPAPADLPAMQKDPNLKVEKQSGLNVAYLAFNTQKPPFDKVEVRRALNHAINKRAIIDAIYLGNAQPAKNPMPPTIWGYNDSVKDYEYNPEKAKELLKKAGFPTGQTFELWTMPVSRPYNPNGKKMGELMQADFAKVGVNVKLVSYDWPTYLAKSKDGKDFSFLQFGWTGDNGDPDNFLNVLLGCGAVEAGGNRARWCDKGFEDLMQKARTATKQAERAALYKKAQVIAKDQAPWITIAHSTVYRAMRNNVTGYKIDPFGGDVFYEVDLK
jgi:dipeptide transport system substrate-binding protein